MFRHFNRWAPAHIRQTHAGAKLHKLARLLEAASPEAIYLELVSQWGDPVSAAVGAFEPPTIMNNPGQWLASGDFVQRMMYADMATYRRWFSDAGLTIEFEAFVPEGKGGHSFVLARRST